MCKSRSARWFHWQIGMAIWIAVLMFATVGCKKASKDSASENSQSADETASAPTGHAESSQASTNQSQAIGIGIRAFEISPDQRHMVACRRFRSSESGEEEFAIEFYQLEPFRLLKTVDRGYEAGSFSFSADERFVCADGTDDEIRIWADRDWQLFAHYKPASHPGFSQVSSFAFDGSYVVTKVHRYVSLINRVDGRSAAIEVGPSGDSVSFAALCSPVSNLIYLGFIYQLGGETATAIGVFDPTTFSLSVEPITVPIESPTNMALSQDGSTLAVAGSSGRIVVFDTDTWDIKCDLSRQAIASGTFFRYVDLCVSPRGTYVATVPSQRGDRYTEVWKVETGEMLRMGPESCERAQFVTDNLICINTNSTGLHFIDVETNRPANPPAAAADLASREPDVSIDVSSLAPIEAMRTLRNAKQYDEAVQYAETLTSPDPANTNSTEQIEFHHEVARCFRFVGDYARAAQHSRIACEVAKRIAIDAVEDWETALHEYADDLVMTGSTRDAIAVFEAAIQQFDSDESEHRYPLAVTKYELGRLYVSMGDWVSANDAFVQAYEHYRQARNAPWQATARCMMWAGTSFAELQEFDKAIPLLRDAHEFLWDGYQRWHPLVCESSLNYSNALRRMKDDAAANQVEFQMASAEDIEHDSAIWVWSQFAVQLARVGRHNESDATARTITNQIISTHGPYHRSIAYLHFELARIYLESELAELALEHAEQAIQRYDSVFGESFAQRGKLLLLLGQIHHALAKPEQSLEYYRQAVAQTPLDTVDQRMSSLHARYHLSTKLAYQHEYELALVEYDQMLRALHGTIGFGIRLLPPRLKYRYAGSLQQLSWMPISDAVERRYDPNWVNKSAEWVINLKGIASDNIAEQLQFARDASAGDGGVRFQRLQTLRQRLSAFGQTYVSTRQESQQAEDLRQLIEEEAQLTAELARATQATNKSSRWISIDEVRDAIPKGNVVVEIMAFGRSVPRTGQIYDDQYAAWIIPATDEGDVRIVALGSRNRIDELIDRYHDMIERHFSINLERQMDQAWAEIYPLTVLLSLRALQPMEATLDKYSRWIICPDAKTWFLPWNGLTGIDGNFVAESRIVTCLYSSRALTAEKEEAEPSQPIILGAPDYNFGTADDSIRAPFGPLPGTEREANAIAIPISTYAGTQIVPLMGEQATEESLRLASSPKLIAISTHGYFDPRNPTLDPLVRCGVALAGANVAYRRSMRDPDAAAYEDGLLTGSEASLLDLRGTQLVFLNACQTGQGMAIRGGGVAGLHQGFHLAGADQVIATLWPIADDESADLAIDFFTELANGSSVDVAFHTARRNLIEELKSRHSFAHPTYFAPFQISGVPSQEDSACELRASRFLTNSIGMNFVRVDAGEFEMGSPQSEVARDNDEQQHHVRITKDFLIGRFEVTQYEFNHVTGRNPSHFSPHGEKRNRIGQYEVENFPVDFVTHQEAIDFCNELSNLPSERAAGRRYRLPTEAEWEFACRGGTQSEFHFGESLHAFWANFDGRQPAGGAVQGPMLGRTTVVGEYPWNSLGIHDMHGNVKEWCQDYYGDYAGQSNDPTGVSYSDRFVIRGGGYDSDGAELRSANREAQPPTFAAPNLGFRVVCEVD